MADGLANDRIMDLDVDSEGFLWICTIDGVSRFDGAVFTTFRVADGLPDIVVNDFLQTRAGIRWVATNGGGIARLEEGPAGEDGHAFTPFPVGETPRSMRVNRLFETRRGVLLAGTDGGLFRSPTADGEPRFTPLRLSLPGTPDASLQVWSMAEEDDGTRWIGTSAGLARISPGGRVTALPVAPGQGADHVRKILVDAAGRLWLGHDRGLIVWRAPRDNEGAGGERRPIVASARPCVPGSGAVGEMRLPRAPGAACHWAPPEPGLRRPVVVPALRMADGHLWMTSEAGLAEYDGSRLRIYGEAQGVTRRLRGPAAVDAQGDLWFGSSRGLMHVQRQGFRHYTVDDGLADPMVERIFEDRDGRLYAAGSAPWIHRFTGDRWVAVRPRLPPQVGRVGRSVYGAVLVDRQGFWWIGSGEGLYRYPPVDRLERLASTAPSARFTTASGLAGNDIWKLFEDSRGDLWISTRVPGSESLTRWRRDTRAFETFGTTDGLPSHWAVMSFAEEPSGGLWFGAFDGGLARFDGDRFETLAPSEALPAGPVRDLLISSNGDLWAAAGDALIRIEHPASPERRRIRTVSRDDRLIVPPGQLLEDRRGRIYVATARGLSRLRPDTGAVQRLGVGAPFIPVRAAHRDRRGELWFATYDGVLRYLPRERPAMQPPSVWIGEVRIDGTTRLAAPAGIRAPPALRLAARASPIQIGFFGVAFGPQQPLRYQFHLAGVDRGWSAPTTDRSVTYAGLPAGRYRFAVRALNAAGRASPEPATLAFTIPPPFWRTWWFLAGLGGALAALAVAFHRLRVARLVEVERVRTRIATDLHDDLGASLARVSLLSELARRDLRRDPAASERALDTIGETSRRLVESAGDIAYAVDPERSALAALVARLRRFADDLLGGSGVGWSVRTHGDVASVTLTAEQRRHLLAILKEGLHNAVKHAAARRIELTVAVDEGSITAELVDDGRGFDCAKTASGEGATTGHGLHNMRRRSRELGARLALDAAPGEGTRLRLTVPCRKRRSGPRSSPRELTPGRRRGRR